MGHDRRLTSFPIASVIIFASMCLANSAEPFAGSTPDTDSDGVVEVEAQPSDSLAALTPDTELGGEGVGLSYSTEAVPSSITSTETSGVEEAKSDLPTPTTGNDELSTTSTRSETSSSESGEVLGSETSGAEAFPVLAPKEEGIPLERLLTMHFDQPTTTDGYPFALAARRVDWILGTVTTLGGLDASVPDLTAATESGDAPSVLAALHNNGLIRISHPRVEQHVLNVRRGLLPLGRARPWWSTTRRTSGKSTLKLVARFFLKRLEQFRGSLSPRNAASRLAGVCDLKRRPAHNLVESLLKVDKLAHVALETAMVGLYGLCTPSFALKKGKFLDCNEDLRDSGILEPALYVPLPMVATMPSGEQPQLELQCSKTSSEDRQTILDAIERPFERSLRDTEEHLSFIPLEPPYKSTKLDKSCPPWHRLLGGTYYENPASDVLERLDTLERVINGLPVSWRDLDDYSTSVAAHICLIKAPQARWIAGEADIPGARGNVAVLGASVARLLTVLKSITGPVGREAEDWKHVKSLLRQMEHGYLPSRHMNTVERYMATYAKLIEKSVLASLVPVSSRSMAMLIIGLWAKQEDNFSFKNPNTRAKSLLLLFLLLNEKGPINEAVNILRSIVERSKKYETINIGTVVTIVSTNKEGKVQPIFRDVTGLNSSKLSLTRKNLSTVLRNIAARDGDPLAPLKAVTGFINALHRGNIEEQGSQESNDFEIIKTRFVAEIHCMNVEREILFFLGSKRARALSYEDKVLLLKGIVSTVQLTSRGKTEAVELRCAFSGDRKYMKRLLNASNNPTRMLHRARRFFRGLKSGVRRWLRHVPTATPPARIGIEVSSLMKTEYVARRQMQGDWKRLFEFATGLPFSTISQMKSFDNPSISLLEPLDLVKLNGIQDRVLIATDIDDTMIASGGMRLRVTGSRLGGVDSKYPLGVSYPGAGGMLYLLSMGSRRRDEGKLRPVETQVLPVMLLTARPSFLKPFFRPGSMYEHIATMYLREAQLLGAKITHPNPQIKYENQTSFFRSVLRGKAGRGFNKMPTLLRLLRKGDKLKAAAGIMFHPETKVIFLGDSFEMDLATGLTLSLVTPDHYVLTFLHIVEDIEPTDTLVSVPETFLKTPPSKLDLPKGALSFKIPVADAQPTREGDSYITGVSLLFKVVVPKRQFRKLKPLNGRSNDEKELPCSSLDLRTAWSVGMKVDNMVRTVLAVHRHRWLQVGLSEILQAKKLPPPPIFVNCAGVVAGNNRRVKLEPIYREPDAPLDPKALGKPVVAHRSALGAMVVARALGLIDNQDLSEFATLVARADGALRPPQQLGDPRGALELQYDAKVAATLFPLTTASLLGFNKMTELVTTSPVGKAYAAERCKRDLISYVKTIMSNPTSGLAYTENDIADASTSMSGVLGDTFCRMKRVLSRICVAAQEEVEYLSGEVAYLLGKVLFKELGCYRSAIKMGSHQSPLLKFLMELCASHPTDCEAVMAILKDISKLARFRTRAADSTQSSEAFLSSIDLWISKRPSILADYADTVQKSMRILVRTFTKAPKWDTGLRWKAFEAVLPSLEDCVIPTMESAFRRSTRPSFLQMPWQNQASVRSLRQKISATRKERISTLDLGKFAQRALK